jgi:hypothetical protein
VGVGFIGGGNWRKHPGPIHKKIVGCQLTHPPKSTIPKTFLLKFKKKNSIILNITPV